MKIVAEQLDQILKPKTQKEITDEIKIKLEGKNLAKIKETKDFVIYHAKRGGDIKDVIRSLGGKDEDVFFNYYLILDSSVTGYRQLIGVKVSSDGIINAKDAVGKSVSKEYLEDKFL